MGILYLRFLIGGLNVLFVVIVACVTLALALTISFKSLRDNADTAVTRLGTVTGQKVDSFFSTPQRQMDNIALAAVRFDGLGMLPSDSPTFGVINASGGSATSPAGEVLHMYRQLLVSTLVEEEFKYLSLSMTFADGSYLWAVPTDIAALGMKLFFTAATWKTGPAPTQQHPLVISAHVLPSGAQNAQATAIIAASLAQLTLVNDLRIPQYRSAIDTLYNSGTKSGTSTVSWGAILFVAVQGSQFFVVPVNRPNVNSTGYQLGYTHLVLRTDDVSALLTEGQLTPATRLVIYDTDGYLFGASSGVTIFTSENFTGTDTTPGCTTTAQSTTLILSDVSKRACRFHLRDTPISTVQTAVKKDEVFFTQGTTAGAVRLVGSQYVYVQRLPTLEGARAFTIAMVVPEEDMIGDAAKILPICAGVTAGVVVLVAAVSLVLVWLVLRPLQGIAERMGKAARLEADDEAVSVSSLVEIGDLQRAFLEMRDELSRIRAFVPQSLLRANDDSDEEYDEFGMQTEGTPITSGVGSRTTVASGNQQLDSSLGLGSSGQKLASSGQFGGSSSMAYGSNANASKRQSAGAVSMSSLPTQMTSFRYAASRRGSGTTVRTRINPMKPKAKLQLGAGVKLENVSVLSMNLRGFHGAVKDGLGVERVAATVEAVLRIAQQEKGVVDSFHGDRFLVSFNAVKPAASHGIRAAIVAARVAEALGGGGAGNASTGTAKGKQGTPYALPVTAGVATGPAQVGNLGSSEMKRFSIVGPVVSQAACLERLCKLYGGASCLVPQRLFADLRTAVLVKTVDYVRVPFAERPMLVGAVLRELSQAADDEWMYQLQQAAEGDGKGAADFSLDSAAHAQMNNDVWDALLGGRTRDANTYFETLHEKSAGRTSPVLRIALDAAKARAVASTPAPSSVIDPTGPDRPSAPPLPLLPHEFGEFYDGAVLDSNAVSQL